MGWSRWSAECVVGDGRRRRGQWCGRMARTWAWLWVEGERRGIDERVTTLQLDGDGTHKSVAEMTVGMERVVVVVSDDEVEDAPCAAAETADRVNDERDELGAVVASIARVLPGLLLFASADGVR